MPLGMYVLIAFGVFAAGAPILFMAAVFESEEKQRRSVGRCGFVEE